MILSYDANPGRMEFSEGTPLGERTAQANSFSDSFASTPTNDTFPQIQVPLPIGPSEERYGQVSTRTQPSLNGHQSALFGMSQLLESMTDVTAEDVKGRNKRLVTGFDGAVDVAIERMEEFLSQQKRIIIAYLDPPPW
jgi:hypothetical protein